MLKKARDRLRARRELTLLHEEMARVLGDAARDPHNLRSRPCPVCGAEAVAGKLAVSGPVYAFLECRVCSMVYAPRVLKSEVVDERYRGSALRRAYREHMHRDARSEARHPRPSALAERLAALAPARRAAIDVGCGFGGLAGDLAAAGFEDVLGLELDEEIAGAAARLHPGARFCAARLETLDRLPGSVDLVTLCQVLEHIEEPGPILDAARRLLTVGGILWAAVPQGDSLGLALLGGRHPQVSTHMHVNLYTAATLTTLLERHGFSVAEASSDDDPGLALAEVAPEPLAGPALALEKGLRWLSARTHLPSRLGRGAHVAVTGRAR